MKKKRGYGYVNKFRPGYPLYNIECSAYPGLKKRDPDFLPQFLPALSDKQAVDQFRRFVSEWPGFYNWRLWKTSPKGNKKTMIAKAKT